MRFGRIAYIHTLLLFCIGKKYFSIENRLFRYLITVKKKFIRKWRINMLQLPDRNKMLRVVQHKAEFFCWFIKKRTFYSNYIGCQKWLNKHESLYYMKLNFMKSWEYYILFYCPLFCWGSREKKESWIK